MTQRIFDIENEQDMQDLIEGFVIMREEKTNEG